MISGLLRVPERQISSTLHLSDENAATPFISRCHKEATGGLDEVQIESIKEQHGKLCDIAKWREAILSTINEQEKLIPKLEKRINATWSPTELEGIYLPYKPKRKTRAEAAYQKGPESLAMIMMLQRGPNLTAKAAASVKGDVKDTKDALRDTRDITTEQVNENGRARNAVCNQSTRQVEITAKVVRGKEEEATKYRDYFDLSESLKRHTSHRLLAIRWAESEGLLKIPVSLDDEACLERLDRQFVHGNNECSHKVKETTADTYKRLLRPSIGTEFAVQSEGKAGDKAIRIFTENLHQLLLSPPLGQKRVLATDPGFRIGYKVVCFSVQDNLLHNENIYPHPPVNRTGEAAFRLRKAIEAYEIGTISIGNGTASCETEDSISHQTFDRRIPVFVVSEQGVPIYSTPKITRDELPNYDMTVHGAAFIGCRLIGPLVELIKIDLKSIGVEQCQHDVNQTKLKKALDQAIENCVSLIGVNLNTASSHLLTYISGLGPKLVQNIVNFRAKDEAFNSRKEPMKVPRMGTKAFKQCADFLRISGAKNPLDNTAMHPEGYHIVEQMAKDLKCSVDELIANKELRQKVKISDYVTPTVDLSILQDIMQELGKPGHNSRKAMKVFEFDKGVRTITDLREGIIPPGIAGNITNFGVFVDTNIKENGLIHLSQLVERYISDPTEIASVHQHVMIRVISVNTDRKQIRLSVIGVQ